MKFCYIITEGPHDVELIGKILKMNGVRRVQLLKKLEDYWIDMIPKNYPPDGDLMKRVPVPAFFQNESVSVAVHAAGSLTRIPAILNATLLNKSDKETKLDAVGVVIDADMDLVPSFQKCIRDIGDEQLTFSALGTPGEIVDGSPRIGVYVLPDNEHPGTLESMVLDGAQVIYPDLLESAQKFVDEADPSYKELAGWKPADRNKAVIGCIANIHKPGKANQVSIGDNDWISETTRNQVPSIQQMEQFLKKLIGME
ncbi:DUF3226 domain-containing protein [Saccharibacillus sacchari]|uniref:DUF3226 domain-containing protein n=1 Tax=Saccharibacillus sacchari TaxID=456493 RepID=UPI0004B44F39|nr:DUF3226 domain-containing protein [Saccharibacillus sacchari]